MPVAMRTTYQKAEAKYNVTTEFPSLGLHSAAATGNLGLVEYALDHGQPINSVLDGVLPLHAACAGGNVQVVKLLIEHGADVNAPRLPRRYSNEKNRDSSAPIVGTSGSTPLHFAAANGNTDAVNLLLLHGAHANRSDKHGITPEMLARQHGWLECADVLKRWLINKDRDLRERPSGVHPTDSSAGSFRERISSFGSDVESHNPATRRRLHVKHSIDNALNKLKSSATDIMMQSTMTSTPPASPIRPFGEYTFVPTSPPDDVTFDAGARRPSLPHILQPSSIVNNRSRKTSTPNSSHSPSPRRPRSAGNGAEVQEPETTNSTQGKPVVRKLGSKYSLLNLFKKAQAGESVPSSESSQSFSTSLAAGSSSVLHMNPSPSQPSPLSHTLATSVSTSTRSGFRIHRGSDAASLRSVSQQPNTPQSLHRKISGALAQSPRPAAVELNNAPVQDRDWRQTQSRDRSRSTGSGARFSPGDHTSHSPSPHSSPLHIFGLRVHRDGRVRSGSGSSLGTSSTPGYRGGAVFDEDGVVASGDSNSARPSILKAHNRATSSGYVPGTPQGFRALRFDSSSSVSARRVGDAEGLRNTTRLRCSSSTGSLGRRRMDILRRGTTPEMRVSEETLTPDSAPAVVTDFVRSGNALQIGNVDDEDEEEYGQPLHNDDRPGEAKSGLLLRQRGASFGSSSQSSLSPIMPSDEYGSTINAEFPFSINKPPVIEPDFDSAAPARPLLSVPLIGDNRIRGDSVSSTGTLDSHNPQLSASGTTSGSGSETVTTPWFSSPGRDDFLDVVPMSLDQHEHDLDYEVGRIKSPEIRIGHATTSLNERRSHIPPDINTSAISAHAQAEALVQKAQRDILEMANSDVLPPAMTSTGRSPLSAKLAAYGESLALERKLRERMEEEERQAFYHKQENEEHPTQQTFAAEPLESGTKTPEASYPRHREGGSGIERQRSLEHPLNRSQSREQDPKRPSTAEGFAPKSVEQTGSFHQSSQSESGLLLSSHNYLLPIEPGRTVDRQEKERAFLPMKSASFSVTSPRQAPSPAPPIRSRTPIPDLGDGYLSRIGDTDTELGPDLCRVSTAPLRGAKTATKLTKMGFPPLEQVRTPATTTKRFGAFRSLVQTFKGRT